jgi:hypothetical protein
MTTMEKSSEALCDFDAFPTLEALLRYVPPYLGLNIEIKYVGRPYIYIYIRMNRLLFLRFIDLSFFHRLSTYRLFHLDVIRANLFNSILSLYKNISYNYELKYIHIHSHLKTIKIIGKKYFFNKMFT